MRIMQTLAVILFLLVFAIFMPNTMAIGGGGGADHMNNPSPDCGDIDIPITSGKGVQTCLSIIVDWGCTVNLTFQWFNSTQYSIDWLDWWMNWPDGGPMPNYRDDAYWSMYGNVNGVNTSGRYCFYNNNVTCATENSWMNWQDWRVIGNFTCLQNYTYDEVFYCYYMPELCPLFYIYPAWNATDVCPCCDAMCIGINNADGHSMNMTVYRNDSQFESFYIVNEYNNITNSTYCFCIDGHVDNNIYYPMKFNETYYWYVNITDVVTGTYEISDIFQFTTAQNILDCPCGEDAIREATGRGEIIRFGSLHGLSIIAFILGVAALLVFFIGYIGRHRKEEE